MTVSASIDVATAGPGTAAGTLLHRADVAMYAVKAAGKDGVLVHGPAMDAQHRREGVGRDDALHAAFAAALREGAVHAVHQPVVDPVTGRITALEALAQWSHAGADVAPAVFLPLATRGGLSGPFTALMLERAAAQLAEWNAGLGHRRMRVAVNVDPVELTDAGLPARIAQLVARHGLTPGAARPRGRDHPAATGRRGAAAPGTAAGLRRRRARPLTRSVTGHPRRAARPPARHRRGRRPWWARCRTPRSR